MKKAVLLVLLAMVTFGAFAIDISSIEWSKKWFSDSIIGNDEFTMTLESSEGMSSYVFNDIYGEVVALISFNSNEDFYKTCKHNSPEVFEKDELRRREQKVAYILTSVPGIRIAYKGSYGKKLYMQKNGKLLQFWSDDTALEDK